VIEAGPQGRIRAIASPHATPAEIEQPDEADRSPSSKTDQVVFMDGGRIVETGTPAEVLARPRLARTQAFLSRVQVGSGG
jgi:hypothetical protein